MAGQSRGAPIKGEYNPTGVFPWQLLFYFNVDKRCLCLSWKAVAERNYIQRWNEYCRSRENLLLWQTNFGGTIWVNWTLTCPSLLVCLFLSPSLYFSFHQSLSLSISFGLLSQSNSVGVHILCVILLGNESDTRRERWKEAVASSSSANKLLFIVSRSSFFFLLPPVLLCYFTHNYGDLHAKMRGGGEDMNNWGWEYHVTKANLRQENWNRKGWGKRIWRRVMARW